MLIGAPLQIFAPEVAEEVVKMLNATNPKILKSAILLSPEAATFNLQAERVIRDANYPARKSFRDADRLLEWLAESLEPDELQAARDFLAPAAEKSEVSPLKRTLKK